jgi:hypothetical protein
VPGLLSIFSPNLFFFSLLRLLAEWLKNDLTLHEQINSIDQAFILKKKFFMSDATVSTDDPVQLHLVYCQVRDGGDKERERERETEMG